MPKTLISVDPKKLPWEQSTPLHNRWHPDIPAIASVAENEVFRVETLDWTGGQIKNDDSADDIKHVDLTQVHYLSGPISIATAEPGDLLKVEILNLGPLAGDEWGFCGTFHKDNGGGFLTDHCARMPVACLLPGQLSARCPGAAECAHTCRPCTFPALSRKRCLGPYPLHALSPLPDPEATKACWDFESIYCFIKAPYLSSLELRLQK
jgi:hypothetical protein